MEAGVQRTESSGGEWGKNSPEPTRRSGRTLLIGLQTEALAQTTLVLI